ncbi:hypothetical protein L21SP5_02307 [Salinivirga cyanobacteriivorans]|uniref:Uncharacterized protein n=1 Tax=Salinivirga cyanobacteriivorans TaxID=1307839 RepID=A0A0S2I0P9_9BACT|nr:hypothetical protein L21SP5_02307 [Salinivirga cyanobacteriivorans]
MLVSYYVYIHNLTIRIVILISQKKGTNPMFSITFVKLIPVISIKKYK